MKNTEKMKFSLSQASTAAPIFFFFFCHQGLHLEALTPPSATHVLNEAQYFFLL